MNTKQVEELTGITRQNIRYYERQGLLEPARDTGNAYRDYSGEDVRRLKLIKMLRMLDMPLKEIEQVLNGNLLLKDAVAKQQENLLIQQKQLQAAMEVCASIRKEKSDDIDVDGYLDRMEHMEKSGSVFARIVDDYKQVAEEERQRQFSFYTEQPVHTAGMFEKVLRTYARDARQKFQMVRPGMYPEFMLDGIVYTAACTVEQNTETKEPKTRIICSRADDAKGKKKVGGNRRALFQMVYLTGRNIRRHRWKSVLNLLISMMTVVVLVFYLGNLISARKQFEELPEAIPVRATVMNARGTMKSRLFIRQQVLDMVYASPHIWKIRETAELIGHQPSIRPDEEEKTESALQPAQEEAKDDLQSDKAEEPKDDARSDMPEGSEAARRQDEFRLMGVNSPDSIYENSEKDFIWADGWNWEKFQDSTNVCLVGNTFLRNRNLEIGGHLACSLERYIQAKIGLGVERESLKPLEMEIVGVVDDTKAGESMEAEVILPLTDVKQIYEENDKVYFASSLMFTVKDPMELNGLKQELKETGLTPVVPGSVENYAGSALRMEDDVFIQAATGLEKSVSLLEGFLPFVLLIVVLAGYIVPHLLLQGRKSEYAIMRALGTGKKRCTMVFFAEHMLLAAAGGAVGAIFGASLGTADLLTAGTVWLVFLCCYTLGAAAAMWMFGRISIAAVLTQQ